MNLIVVFAMMFAAPLQTTVQARVWTDQADYAPGSTVTIHGDNQDDSGLTYTAGETVLVTVTGPNGYSSGCQALVGDAGAWACDVQLWRSLEAVGDYYYTAVGQTSGKTENGMFSDSAGSYALNWSAADPAINNAPFLPTYAKVPPGAVPCPTPSGGTGRASDPLTNAVFGSPKDSVESLMPKDMALGQIVPFELKIAVDGSIAPEGGIILVTADWLAKTTSGGDFGFDPAYGVYCAFVDYGDSASIDPGGDAKVDSFAATTLSTGTNNERIQGTLQISGLDSGDSIIVEIWVVLKSTMPEGVSGNVQTGLVSANTVGGEVAKINVGNQTVPLLQAGDFLTNDADLSITKSDSPDPVMQGGQLSYTLSVTNNSTDIYANGVVVADTLDPNVSFVSASPAICSTVGGVVTCNVGALAPLQVYNITLVTTVAYNAPSENDRTAGPATGTCTPAGLGIDLCNTASVTSIYTDDPNSANNSDSEPTNVLAAAPAIDIVKDPDTQTVVPGGTANFTITVTNTGNVALSNVAVTDALAPGCAGAIGALAVGASTSYSCSLTNVTANFTNSATASGSYGPTTVSDTDTAAVVVDFLPTVDLAKSVDPLTLAEPGGIFTYTLTIHNTSVEPVTITALTDTYTLSAQCLALIGTSLAADDGLAGGLDEASCTYTATHNAVGPYENTASVTVTDGQGNPASDTATASVTVTDVQPTLLVDKSASPVAVPETGGLVTYTVVVTNTSIEPVTLATLSDDVFGTLTGGTDCQAGTVLAPSASCSFTFTATVAGEVGTPHVNTATVTATDNEGNTTSGADSAEVTFTNVAPTVTLDKSVDLTSLPEPGGDFIFTLTITNTSAEPVTITALSDDNPLSAECLALIGTSLAAGASTSCSYTVAHGAVGSYDNTASVTVTDNEGSTASASDSETVTVTNVLPTVTLDKSATPATLPEPGGNFTFTLTITNTSAEAVTITALTDDNALSAECLALIGTSLAAGASASCSYIVAHINTGSYENTANVTVTDNEGSTANASDSETVTVTDVLPDISVLKTANPTAVPETGGNVTFTFRVTNDGIEPVTISSLSDDEFGALAGDADCQVGTVLAPAASCYFSITRFISGDFGGPDHHNIFTAIAADDDGNSDTATDDETVTIQDVLPDIAISKTASPTSVPETGGLVEFTIVVTNNSPETATITSLVDSDFDLAAYCPSAVGTTLAYQQSYTCSFSVTLSSDSLAQHANTATVIASDGDGNTDTAFDDATVDFTDVLPDISVTKTAGSANVPETGGLVTFTFVVTNNSLEAATITALSDDRFGPLTGDSDCQVGTVLLGGASCSFDATFSIPAGDFPGSHVNIFTATGEDNDGNEDSGSDSETVPYTDVLPSVTVLKTASTASVPETGAAVTFTFRVTNNGPEAATISALSDSVYGPLSGDADCQVGTPLVAGAYCEFEITRTVSGDYPGSHTNTFTGTIADDDGNTDTAFDDATVDFTDVLPDITVTKSANPTSVPETGSDVTFTFVVTNNSAEAAAITVLSDDHFGALAGSAACHVGTVLLGGETCSFTAVFAIPAGDYPGSHVNIFTATVSDGDGNSDSATDDATVTYTDVAGSINVIKTANPTSVPETGGLVTYTVRVENTSAVDAVTISTLTDDIFGDLDGVGSCDVPQTIAVGGFYECAFQQTIAQDYPFTHTNVATATGTDEDGQPVSDFDDADVTIIDVAGSINVIKTANPTSVPETGGLVTYTVRVENTSAVDAVTISALTDDTFGDLDGVGSCDVPQTIAVGGFYECAFQQTIAHDYPFTHTNVATASGTDEDGQPVSDFDDADVTIIDVLPDITVTKTAAAPGTVPETGGPMTFTFEVTNNSAEAATITALSDDQFGVLSGDVDCHVDTVLAGGASCSFDATFNIPAGDFPGSHVNVFTGTVADGDGNNDSDTDDETVPYTDVLPDITVTKTAAAPGTVPETGGPMTFTFQVTNNSAEAATITALSDSEFGTLGGDVDCHVGTVLAGGASCSFDATFSIPAGDVPGSHVNIFTATVSDGDGNNDSDTDDETVPYTDVLPDVIVTKTAAAPGTVPETGGPMTFTFEVTNNSLEAATITALSDSEFGTLGGDVDCHVGTVLAGGASCSFDATFSIPAGDFPGSHVNVFTGTVTDGDGNNDSDTDDETVTYTDVLPDVTVTKTAAAPGTVPETGGPMTFTFEVTNNSAEAATITALSDNRFGTLGGDVDCHVDTVLAGGASCSFDATFAIPAGDFPGSHVNTFTGTVADGDGNNDSDTDDETVPYTDVLPDITVTKTAAVPGTVPETGGLMTFTFEVTNNSAEAATITALSDSQFGTLGGDANCHVGTVLAGGASCSFDATFSIPAGDFPGSHVNTFTGTVTDGDGNEDSDTDDETVPYTDVQPAVTLDKSVTPASLPEPGGEFTFTLSITNDSTEAATITALGDDNALSAECLALIGASIAAGQTVSCSYTVTHTEAGSYPNTAVVTLADDDGNSASASDDESVTVTDVLPTVDLTKTASPASLPEPGGVFTFTLSIHNLSVEAVTITALTDINALSPECTALIDTSIPAGGTVNCTYTVTHTEAGSYPNTASVTVADNEGNPASDSDGETVTVTDVLPVVDLAKNVTPASLPEPGGVFTFTLIITNNSVENVTITALTDSNALPAECTDLIGDVLTPGQVASCNYTVAHNNAGTYPNTASVTVADNEGNQASDRDSKTVTVTDVAPTITVDKSASQQQVFAPGEAVTFTVVINNTSVSTDPVTITSLIDSIHGDLNGQGDCSMPQTILPGGSYTCAFTVTVNGDETDTVTAGGADDEGTPVSGSDSASVDMINPSIAIDKVTVDGTTEGDGLNILIGEPISWKFTVTNDGDVPLSNITVTDDQLGTICTVSSLAVGASATCSVSGAAAIGSYSNTGTAATTYTDLDDHSAARSDSDSSSYFGADPQIAITKVTVDGATSGDGLNILTGEAITWRYTVTNAGNVVLANVGVTDDQGVTVTCPQATLAVDESMTCTATGTAVTGAYSNTGTASGSYTDGAGHSRTDTASDTSSYFGADPQIAIVKVTVDGATSGDGLNILTGESIGWKYTVSNIGNVALSSVAVTDSRGVSVTCPQATLAVGESMDCTATGTAVTGAYSNTGTASGRYTDSAGHSRTDAATDGSSYFGANPQIAIVKTTADAFGNEGDAIGILPGETVTWNYLVTNTGNVALSNVGVIDDQGVTVTCPQATLAVGESMTCTASGTAAAGWYHNTGTASGSYTDSAGHIRTDTASDASSYYGVTPGGVTNSQLCDFGDQFRLVFTPDMQRYTSATPYYKLSDSNPGQFFYNLFYVGTGSETITLEIPYPFVSQGAMPVHVYGGLTVYDLNQGTPTPDNLTTCYLPNDPLAAYPSTFTLANYTDTNGDGSVGYGDVYLLTVPAEAGFQYINLHLDYGLEKMKGWLRKGANVIGDPLVDPLNPGVTILDHTAHIFQAYADGALIPGITDTVYNYNEFKQVRGFGGLVYQWDSILEEYIPVPGARIELRNIKGVVVETMTTDADGWYLSSYIYTGKLTSFTLRLLDGGPTITVAVGGKIKYGEGIFYIGGPSATLEIPARTIK